MSRLADLIAFVGLLMQMATEHARRKAPKGPWFVWWWCVELGFLVWVGLAYLVRSRIA